MRLSAASSANLMRPILLFPLFAPVTTLPGVGPRLAALFDRAVGADTEAGARAKVVDLLWHLPTGIIDRRFSPTVQDAPEGVIATLTGPAAKHVAPLNPGRPYRTPCHDKTGTI